MGEGVESSHVGYLRYVVFPLYYQGGGTVELVSLEEDARVLASQSFYLIV